MNECAHLIYIPFSGVGLHGGFRGDTWYSHRIEIFKKYTLRSLANQSNKNFLVWCSFRPEEEKNPLTREIAKALAEAGLSYVFTFNGLMYHDDKFTDFTLKRRIKNALRMLWDCYWYKEWKNPFEIIRQSWENKNETLKARLRDSLSLIESKIGKDYEWIYMTRIDSDDMFHREAINLIQSQPPDWKRSLVFTDGYILNTLTGQVAEWNPPTNPPFHTVTIPGHVFFDASAYMEYYGDFKTHEDATTVWNPVVLDMHKYMVGFHAKGHISTDWESPLPKRLHHALKYKGYCYTTSGRNISTQWESRTGKVKNFMIGKEFFGEEKQTILKDFGLA